MKDKKKTYWGTWDAIIKNFQNINLYDLGLIYDIGPINEYTNDEEQKGFQLYVRFPRDGRSVLKEIILEAIYNAVECEVEQPVDNIEDVGIQVNVVFQ